MLWGHSYEFEADGNWDVIERFAAYTGNRDEIWYATNLELYDYMTAYDRLLFSADGSMVWILPQWTYILRRTGFLTG